MPRPAINDYTFYKIININGDVDLCYVGSTCNMKQRTINHKSDCNNVSGKHHNRKLYTTIREHGGWNEFKMVEIGHREQLTLAQSRQIEEDYRVELKANLNMIKCFQANQSEYQKKHYEDNKEVCNQRHRNYNETHKQKISAWKATKIVCECGTTICQYDTSRHRKSQKHINLMNAKTD